MVHAALAIAEPGDVIVVDGKGDTSAALLGGLLAIGAMKKGVAGFVFDGAVRDGSEMVEAGLPIFCRGVSPVAPDHDGPGQVNVPISCGGVPVGPGDVICADADGIVVVPLGLIDQTIEAAAKKDAADVARAKEIEAGQINQSWLIPILRKNGVLGPDEEL
jgi:regulator of RNase E activity RraA